MLFWKDNWTGHNLQSTLPHLHSFAVNDEQYFLDFYGEHDWTEHFHMPLSIEAYEEFNQL